MASAAGEAAIWETEWAEASGLSLVRSESGFPAAAGARRFLAGSDWTGKKLRRGIWALEMADFADRSIADAIFVLQRLERERAGLVVSLA